MPDLFNMILGDLRTSVLRWNRLLSGGLLFAVLCHFYILEPYFRYKLEEQRIRHESTERTNEVAKLSAKVDLLESVTLSTTQTLARVRRQISDYPNHLRARLPEIRDIIISGDSDARQSPPRQVGNFQMPLNITNFEAGVRWYVATWFEGLIQELKVGVVDQLAKAESGGMMTGMQEEADRAITNLQSHLDGLDPDFWRRYGEGGKSEVAEQLKRVVEEFFGPIEKRSKASLELTRSRLDKEQASLSKQQLDLEQISERGKELEARLQALESPLGRLPLGLPDLITLFPLIIAGLILMLTGALKRSHRLKTTLQRMASSTSQSFDRVAFELCVDCWFLPPYRNLTRLLLLITSISILVFVMVRASWLIVAGPGALAPGKLDAELSRGNALLWAYAMAYVTVLWSLISWWRTFARKSG